MLTKLWNRRMTWLKLAIPIIVLLFIAAGVYTATAAGRVTDQEMLLLGQTQLSPGSPAALRAVVRDFKTGQPVANAAVVVRMAPRTGGKARTLFEGRTDASGSAPLTFTVPDDVAPEQTLIVEARSGLGHDRVEKPVTVQREYKILLTTDKPLYQPGQVIHIRALALSTIDLVAADRQTVQFTVEDPKGNKVGRHKVETSAYGIASWDFQLAGEVNNGPYKITAEMGETSSEKTVTVKPYVLPKFKVSVETERPFYLPGEVIRGLVSADYFFGKPVAGGEVRIRGYTYAVGQEKVLDLRGMADDEGRFAFEFAAPEYFVGGALEEGQASLGLEVTVIDQAQHAEETATTVPIARERVLIEAVPESGALKPDVENIVYILTSFPDGTPAETALEVEVYGSKTHLDAGRYGLADFTFVPRREPTLLRITAATAQGDQARRDIELSPDYAPEAVLLRPERALYQVGETMHLDVFTSGTRGTIYLDIVKEGQAVSTRALDVANGRASAEIDLDQTLFGTLTLHAYRILRDGTIVRDTRLVVVTQATGIDLQITPDQDTYRPGGLAKVQFQTTVDGQPIPSALGITAVDESVFALQEQEAGFAKLYFLLQQELLEPKYDIHGLKLPALLPAGPVTESEVTRAQDTTAKAALAQAPAADARPLINSHQEKVQSVEARQNRLFQRLSAGVTVALVAAPLLVGLITLIMLLRRRVLVASLALTALTALALLGLVSLLPGPPWRRPPTLLDRIEWLLSRGSGLGMVLLALVLIVAAVVAFIGLVVYALRHRDDGLQISLLLLMAYGVLIPILAYTASQAPGGMSDRRVLTVGLSLLALPLAFLLRGMGHLMRREAAVAVASILMGLGILPALIPVGVSAVGMGARGDVFLEEAVPLAAMEQRVLETVVVEKEVVKVVEKTLVPAPTAAAAGVASTQEPPRLRQFFPETLYVNPEVLTDENGVATVEIPMADSITTWRLSALASSQKGALGSGTAGLRVFQDFFIDLDLPLALTQDDEIAVPVAVFNYLPQAQEVRLELAQEPWFELLDEASKTMTIAANDVEVVYFRLRAREFGTHRLTVTAWGERMSDAIARDVRVLPDGKQVRGTVSERLEGPATQSVVIPEAAIPGTARVWVKIYPGVVSQVVEGLEGMLRMPMGCFEQTSSLTYPNVLVLSYLKATEQLVPEVQLKAEEYIALGYQRLLTFEVDGGGFSLFGQPPANVVLSSYGLMEFGDMARVHEVDPALLERTARWIMARQQGDGSWRDDAGFVHEDSWRELSNQDLPITAYVVWALVDAGYEDEGPTQRGLSYLRQHWAEADDAYVLALVANALVADDPKDRVTKAALEKLDGMKVVEGDKVMWPNRVSSFMGSEGQTGSVETTALAAYALLRADAFPQTVKGALNYLIANKDSFGSWHSTQATVLALKTLLLSATRAAGAGIEATVHLSFNGEEADPVYITPENADVVHLVSFTDKAQIGENTVRLDVEGEGNLMYQVTTEYYIPWELVPDVPPAEELVTIKVDYDKTELAVNDEVMVRVQVALNEKGASANTILVDLGVPPGFVVAAEDLSALVESGRISRYELTGRQILVYLEKMEHGRPVDFTYRLRAKFPIRAKTPASAAYDYYNPEARDDQVPQVIVVQ